MIAMVPVLAMVLGALIYGISTNPKVAEMGRLVFGSGCLVLVYILASHSVTLLR